MSYRAGKTERLLKMLAESTANNAIVECRSHAAARWTMQRAAEMIPGATIRHADMTLVRPDGRTVRFTGGALERRDTAGIPELKVYDDSAVSEAAWRRWGGS